MTNATGRESFPTFQTVWDGNAHKVETAVWEDSSSQLSASQEEKTSDTKSQTIATSKKPGLFSTGTAAKVLWSTSPRNLSPSNQEWKCEECNFRNIDMLDNECAFCGTKISDMNRDNKDHVSDVVREFFVEEDQDDDEVSPMSPTTPQKAVTSLRDLLSRHPSFKKTRDQESAAASTPTFPPSPAASLSPSSPTTYSPRNINAITQKLWDDSHEYGFELDPENKDKNIEFSTMGHPPHKGSASCKTRNFITIPILLMMVVTGILLGILLPRSSTTDENHASSDVQENEQPSSSSSQFVGKWVELEQQEVFADEPDYHSGASISLANNGRRMAVGVGNFGPVRAYKLVDEEYWVQEGQDISFSEGRKHVALSRTTGQFMAIASETDGSVAVFILGSETGLWEPYGEKHTFGVTNRNDAKASVSMSYDGKILAIGVPSVGPLNSDRVRVVTFDDEVQKWVPIGEDLLLDHSERTQHGGSVSLSRDGTILAVGSWAGGDEYSSFSSHAEVYRFSNNTWQHLGKGRIGSRISDSKSEVSVSLSGNGSILAIGGGSSTRVFQYNQTIDKWSQIGQDLVGETVSLSLNGKVMAVGNPGSDVHGSDAGETAIYALGEGDKWTQVGKKILGKSEGDSFGAALSLSEDGKRVAVGAPGSSGSIEKSGSVVVFELVV